MKDRVPTLELNKRMNRFRKIMDTQNPNWDMAVIFSKINLLYFTGSMADGMLIIERDKGETLWARISYERTLLESNFEPIRLMHSYRDAAESFNKLPSKVYLETEYVPLAMYNRFRKHFPFEIYESLDFQISTTRTIKSTYELAYMREAGAIHQHILEEIIPTILREGMTETDLAAELYAIMVKEGHHGTARFAMHDTEIIVGQLGFGDSSLFPTNFDGPGGNLGLNAAVPSLGNRNKKLNKGDLVFIDMGLGVNGYHSDKTMTYMFGAPIPAEAIKIHKQCVDIQNRVADMLIPGNIPETIYQTIMNDLSPEFQQNFMGFNNKQVKFIGHGIGLTVDEYPVIAKGFKEPLVENMVLAIEPKKGIEGVGMVGIENTFIVTSHGGESISGTNPGLIEVY